MNSYPKALGAIILVFQVFALWSIYPIKAMAEPSDMLGLVEGNNTFALGLYHEVAKGDGNFFLSPYSISSALAMTYAGAAGRTQQQMAQTMNYNLEPKKLHAAFSELTETLNEPEKGYQLSVVNALWKQVGLELVPEYLDTVQKYYRSSLQEVDYVHKTEEARLKINSWVEAKTNHKVVDLLKPEVLDNLTRLVLTNAIYFKAAWESEFDPRQTRKLPFHVTPNTQVDVPMMHRTGRLKYTETDKLQVLELPYSEFGIAMDLFLPKSGSVLIELEGNLTLANVDAWLSGLRPRTVDMLIPRFKLEAEFSLGKILQNMGMVDAFDENAANFSAMSTTFLYINKVIHKAFIDVNEQGTEAAAATAVVMGTKSISNDSVIFEADHPFMFIIRDLRSGSILFVGRCVNPS